MVGEWDLQLDTAANVAIYSMNFDAGLIVSWLPAQKPYASLVDYYYKQIDIFKMYNYGCKTIAASNIVRAGASNMMHDIPFPVADPKGSNFAVIATLHTGSSGDWA